MSIIHSLIAQGETETAIRELMKTNNDAVLLLGTYTSTARENRLGLVDRDDYDRTIKRLNNSVLEMAGQGKTVFVDNSVHVTHINMTMSARDFTDQVAETNMDVLIHQCNVGFKGTAIFSEYLDIRNQYQKTIELGEALPVGYIKGVKAQIVKMYTDFVTKKSTEKVTRQHEDLTEAYAILKAEQLNKLQLLKACDLMLIFLDDNRDSRGSHIYAGKGMVDGIKADIVSDTSKLLEEHRPTRFQEKIDQFQRDLSAMANKILSALEK